MRPVVVGLMLAIASMPADAQTRSGIIDLSCDQIVFDRARDSTRLELHRGVADSAAGATRDGRLIVRRLPFRPLEALEGSTFVRVFRGQVLTAEDLFHQDSAIVLVGAAGSANLELSCMRCGRVRTPVEFVAGRTDTLYAYLTRHRDACEADSAKKAAADGARVRPPNGGW